MPEGGTSLLTLLLCGKANILRSAGKLILSFNVLLLNVPALSIQRALPETAIKYNLLDYILL